MHKSKKPVLGRIAEKTVISYRFHVLIFKIEIITLNQSFTAKIFYQFSDIRQPRFLKFMNYLFFIRTQSIIWMTLFDLL